MTELDGIDIYERARLSAEGVDDVEALAHGNVVDLLLQTRIQAGRLIDSVDQSILYLYTTGGCNDQAKRRHLFEALRMVGVRTATDLDRAGRTELGKTRLAEVLSNDVTRPHLDLVLGSIAEAQWMPNLRRWRENPDPPHHTLYLNEPVPPFVVDVSTNGNGNGHGGGPKAS